MWKWIKRGAVAAVALGLGGFFVFGSDVYSYVTSSGRMIQQSVKESVPFEFEIRRVRHLLEDLIPQMHANIKLIAEEEVEVATLERELERERLAVREEREKIQTLRSSLGEQKISYTFSGRRYSRDQVVEELGRRFESFQSAEVLLASKEKLLANRRMALDAARQKLDKMRAARLELASQVENLEGQFRLAQAQAATSQLALDDSTLAQIHKTMADLRKRLEVSQRVLAHEARFIENIPVDDIDEESLLDTIDAHFDAPHAVADRGL